MDGEEGKEIEENDTVCSYKPQINDTIPMIQWNPVVREGLHLNILFI